MTTGSIGPGTLLAGRYRLEDLLSESGGARFWRATDTVLARNVAVHAVPTDDDRASGLLEAARVSATVTDSHLLRVLDCDASGQTAWVVNEWGDGISLDLMLQHGTLPPGRAAWLAREVAEAIAVGHAQGVAHGRLNPEVVMVTHSGAVKLIGYVVDSALHPPRSSEHFGELDDQAADVIDLAGILYAALTGKWPGVSRSDVPPAPREGGRLLRPRQVRAGVPRALDALCDRVLNRDGPSQDHAITTAHEIAAALSDFVGDPAPATPVTPDSMHDEPTQMIAPLPPDTPPPAPPRAEPQPEQVGLEETAPHSFAPPGPPVTEVVQPPPPFEDSPERPLFASGERRTRPVPAPASGEEARPGGTDSEDRPTGVWPFDEEEEPAEIHTGKEGRGWLRSALVVGVLLVVVVAMVVAFNIGRGGGTLFQSPSAPDDSPAAESKPLRIVAAQDFDPEGDTGEENPDDAELAIDGDPDTGWPTLTYRGNPALGGLKSGVGLIIDLGRDRDPRSMTVRFAGSPTSFEVYAASQGVTSPPTSIDQVDKVATKRSAGTEATVELRSEPTTRFLLIWLTRLPPYSGGYRGEITEVTVRS